MAVVAGKGLGGGSRPRLGRHRRGVRLVPRRPGAGRAGGPAHAPGGARAAALAVQHHPKRHLLREQAGDRVPRRPGPGHPEHPPGRVRRRVDGPAMGSHGPGPAGVAAALRPGRVRGAGEGPRHRGPEPDARADRTELPGEGVGARGHRSLPVGHRCTDVPGVRRLRDRLPPHDPPLPRVRVHPRVQRDGRSVHERLPARGRAGPEHPGDARQSPPPAPHPAPGAVHVRLPRQQPHHAGVGRRIAPAPAGSVPGSQIRAALAERVGRFDSLFPDVPVVLGEVGATFCPPFDERNQARVLGDIVSYARSRHMGFNIWHWSPVPGEDLCTNHAFQGLAITRRNGGPRPALSRLEGLPGFSPRSPAARGATPEPVAS